MAEAAREAWTIRPERGATSLIRFAVWIILRIGRRAGHLLLPVCAYFLLFSPKSSAASIEFLSRALGRPPTMIDRWRHYLCFATCLLDRVLLLNGRVDMFDVTLHGEADITAMRAQGGCFLFGAHLGSFEVVRAVGRHIAEAKTSLVMYEDNARKTNAVLHAINPELAMQIIGLGKPGSMLAVRDRLNEGYLVGLLKWDRYLPLVGNRAAGNDPISGCTGALSRWAIPHGGDARAAGIAHAGPAARRPPL